jgi:GNAT superfamily N-acetyltransferase
MDRFADVRLAVPEDEGEILRLTPMIHEEVGHGSYNPEKVRAMVQKALRRDGGIIGVIGPVGDLKGCIYLLLDPIWYGDDWQLVELWNYVRPDARRSDYGIQMIEFAKDCADRIGLKLFIGVFNAVRLAAKVRLYDRHLKREGAFYVHQPAGGR